MNTIEQIKGLIDQRIYFNKELMNYPKTEEHALGEISALTYCLSLLDEIQDNIMVCHVSKGKYKDFNNSTVTYDELICPSCGLVLWNEHIGIKPNYCPWCGQHIKVEETK